MADIINPSTTSGGDSPIKTNRLKHFKFWCQKIIPLVYDDALSYYEVLCKVRDYINQIIDIVNNHEDRIQALEVAVEELQELVAALQTRVSALETRVGALETLVQTLQNLIAQLQNRVTTLESKVSMLESEVENLSSAIDGLDERIDDVDKSIDNILEPIVLRGTDFFQRSTNQVGIPSSGNYCVIYADKHVEFSLELVNAAGVVDMDLTITLVPALLEVFDASRIPMYVCHSYSIMDPIQPDKYVGVKAFNSGISGGQKGSMHFTIPDAEIQCLTGVFYLTDMPNLS